MFSSQPNYSLVLPRRSMMSGLEILVYLLRFRTPLPALNVLLLNLTVSDMLANKKVLLPLSGGINSAAVACWMVENAVQVGELHVFYSHFREHSDKTASFVIDQMRFLRKHYPGLKLRIIRNSVLDFFEKQKMIPHPIISPCSRNLKIVPINQYAKDNGIEIDLVGYVKHELKRRSSRQRQVADPSVIKLYPIGDFTDEWCFEIVLRYIGWYPSIYEIRDSAGKRVFKHNNCLPCKNMTVKDFQAVKDHYPVEYNNAMLLSARLGKHWGRDKDQFYMTFGREVGQEDGSTCGVCSF